ncbi:MAG: hypothetical protein LDL47_06920 [Cyanobacteria bacterium KgW148]|nr:hypothetical protein [Cyanobacteria bacterium KgW148]
MSLRRLIAEMVVVRACGHLYDRQIQYPQWELNNARLRALITDYGVGGVILLGGSSPEIYLRVQQLQSWAEHPLLIAADVEEGVGQRFAGATRLPPAMAFAQLSPDRSFEMGRITAQEASSLGINWLLAPVADVNSNPHNPVINVRAFGETPATVADRVRAFIEGAHQHPVLTTAKHFPGHGDTTIDSHLATPVLAKSLDQLRGNELIPFQAAIGAGVDSIMTAHLLLPQIDSQIVTLSPPLVSKLLRGELGFQGLIVTDALVMQGIADRSSLADMVIGAVLAGHDLLLMPPDPIAAIEVLYQAVQRGQISLDRIYESVNRIRQYKSKFQPVTHLPDLDCPPNQHVALSVAQESIYSIHPGQIPLSAVEVNLILTDRYNSEFCPLIPDRPNIYGILSQLEFYLIPPDRGVVVQIYTRGNPFQGSLAGLEDLVQFLQGKKVLGGILYGNPYLIPPIKENFSQPWLFSYGHDPQCQRLSLDRLLEQKISQAQGFTD